MVDMFLPPTKEQKEKAFEVYGDALMYWAMNCAIKSLEQVKNSDYSEVSLREWKRITRLMMINSPLLFLQEEFDKIFLDIANKTWDGKTFEEVIKGIEKEVEKKEEQKKKIVLTNNVNSFIKQNLKITQVAKYYGLKVIKNKCVCPFHADTQPSLSFYDKTNTFFCFGCRTKGDLITFIQKMGEMKEDGEKGC